MRLVRPFLRWVVAARGLSIGSAETPESCWRGFAPRGVLLGGLKGQEGGVRGPVMPKEPSPNPSLLPGFPFIPLFCQG
jgi:hypothetical protein